LAAGEMNGKDSSSLVEQNHGFTIKPVEGAHGAKVATVVMTAKKIDENEETESELPPVGLNVWVQCEGYRCLAYRTKDGKWMTAIGHKEVKNVIRVVPFE
jgi:hypothetical protein